MDRYFPASALRARQASADDQKCLDGPGANEIDVPLRPSPASGKRSTAKRAAPAPRAPIIASDTPQFEAIRALLARHIGPIAKLFVEKAASEAQSSDEFCERLATHVAAPSDRTSFVQALRKQLAAKP